MAAPSYSRSPARRSTDVYTQCNNDKDFALTFDDGPYDHHSKIRNTLEAAGAKGTFFVNGNNYDCIYDHASDIQESFDNGHVMASHTWTHTDITTLSAKDLNSELDKVETAFRKILGVKPRYFRPPFGAYDDKSLEVLSERGYTVVTWSLDSGDSVGKDTKYSHQQYAQQAKKFPEPGIGLNHETIQSTADTVVPDAIRTLQDAGYNLVSMDECLGAEPYDYVGGQESQNLAMLDMADSDTGIR
ncbi:hypothetical protein EMMF5_003120 [Cystobasidiomycetes sp. EMM_F5]